MTTTHVHDHSFPTAVDGLPACGPSTVVELGDGDTYDLRIAPVVNELGDTRLRMLAYNGSIPGPTLRVAQGSEATVRVRNDGDHETTVHWHGLRLQNAYDGVPEETQAPIPVGGEFVYRLRFPDDGVYWYHPHVREDYGLEMGLYGNIIVDPPTDKAWPAVNREAIVTLDDILLEDGRITPFRTDGPTHTAMGRFGNVMLTGGSTDLTLDAQTGEVLRFFFTNTANTRIFNVSIPGTRMKLVGGDSGRCERQEWTDSELLAPSERAVVDVLFDTSGTFPIEHRTPDRSYRLGSVIVTDPPTERSLHEEFETLHVNDELATERARLDQERTRTPDKTLVFTASMPILYGSGDSPPAASSYMCPMHPEITSDEPGTCPKCGMRLVPAAPTTYVCPMHPHVTSSEPDTCPKCGMKLVPSDTADVPAQDAHHHDHAHDSADGLEWEDLMPEINARTDASNMIWRLVDQETGAENTAIDWTFTVGDRVKIRLVNTMDSDHPMHHPFHIHGAGRFLVVDRDGQPPANLVWKDTVLVRAGETADIVLEVTEPGLWMAHCHIAEHNQDGMMFSFRVDQPRTHRIGTHAWSLRTGGQLTAAERTSMIPVVISAQARIVAGRIAMAAHLNRGRRRDLDPSRLTPPATILTRVAETHAVAHLDATLLNHSLRTYTFGAALGLIDHVEVDHELLYTAALLHDVALPDGAGDGLDFTVASAAVALQVADDVGLPSTAAETLASAITLHHSPDVRPSDGPVAYLLSAGAALDVIGLRAWDLPPSAIAAVVAQHPRLGFKREFARVYRQEAARVPRGRAQFLQRYAAFGLAIRVAPFRG